MIQIVALADRDGPVSVGPLTLTWGAGVHALVGAKIDGGPLVLECLARGRSRAGTARIFGVSSRDPSVRRAIAHVPREVSLPDAMRVDEALAMASELRGDVSRDPRDPRARLATLGIDALALRRVRTLSPNEARAVALAEAVTSGAQVILVDEPFLAMDERATPHVGSALRARAAAGACVVVATASTRDAFDLAAGVVVLERGRAIRTLGAGEPIVTTGARGACLSAIASDPRVLASALSREADVASVELTDGAVVLRGADPATLAAAVARAVLATQVALVSLRVTEPTLGELRSAAAGDLAGAYRAAFDRARGHAWPQAAQPAHASAAPAPPPPPHSPS